MANNMASAFFIFPDQSVDSSPSLTELLKGRQSILTTLFLEKVAIALRFEISQLPSTERERVPNFSTIHELNERYHGKQVPNPALDSALLTICQLAQYIE
jgi:hypothetical protein